MLSRFVRLECFPLHTSNPSKETMLEKRERRKEFKGDKVLPLPFSWLLPNSKDWNTIQCFSFFMFNKARPLMQEEITKLLCLNPNKRNKLINDFEWINDTHQPIVSKSQFATWAGVHSLTSSSPLLSLFSLVSSTLLVSCCSFMGDRVEEAWVPVTENYKKKWIQYKTNMIKLKIKPYQQQPPRLPPHRC